MAIRVTSPPQLKWEAYHPPKDESIIPDSAVVGQRLIAQNRSYGPNADRWAGPAPTINENPTSKYRLGNS